MEKEYYEELKQILEYQNQVRANSLMQGLQQSNFGSMQQNPMIPYNR